MEDPTKRDPRFPDRPTHEDFAELSWAVQANDAESDAGRFEERIREFIDLDSLVYMARQRALRVCALKGVTDPQMIAGYAGAIVDGFVAGAAYERGRMSSDPR